MLIFSLPVLKCVSCRLYCKERGSFITRLIFAWKIETVFLFYPATLGKGRLYEDFRIGGFKGNQSVTKVNGLAEMGETYDESFKSPPVKTFDVIAPWTDDPQGLITMKAWISWLCFHGYMYISNSLI